jgi:ATP-dependent Clp protease ATP-binding subunit ClpC
MTPALIALAVLVGLVVSIALAAQRGRRSPPVRRAVPPLDLPAFPPAQVKLDPQEFDVEALYACANELGGFYQSSALPEDFIGREPFERGVALLATEPKPSGLIALYRGDNPLIACIALEALVRRESLGGEDVTGPLLQDLDTVAPWCRWYALKAIAKHARGPVVARVLQHARGDWWRSRFGRDFFAEFVRRRVAAGEIPTLGNEQIAAERLPNLETLIASLDEPFRAQLLAELESRRASQVDVGFLATFGRVLGSDVASDVVAHRALEDLVERLAGNVDASRRRPTLLVGPEGCGKSATLRALSARLIERGFVVFEASPTELVAGQTHIGELEARMTGLRTAIARRRAVWLVPQFHELAFAGRHSRNPTSVLDVLLPAFASGEIAVVGETASRSHETLLKTKPSLGNVFETIRVEPLESQAAVDLVTRWLTARGAHATPAVLHEANQLAEQYLAATASPGRLIAIAARAQAIASERAEESKEIGLADVIEGLSRLTGLPRAILDDREMLDLAAMRAFLETRVKGQDEATAAIVERVAMLKAGLVDPSRPIGVFLFTGPTGTGKTELAKALAEWLFGAEERLVRIDMSELHDHHQATSRIIGGDGVENTSLVDQVRRQPFSVVLLDEFEKADPAVFDLFLQVFDDGRLTDAHGNTADLRHAIVIMTSNLGGRTEKGASIGFRGEGGTATAKALDQSFRREFVNRIDRVVTFEPLSRTVMREILRSELDRALALRGLRTRQWAIEIEESAMEFLLDRGFTPDLGARPLKRAIERYFLAPLARTIVEHAAPKGDQFLFVRGSSQGLEVEFVDPDASQGTDAEGTTPSPGVERGLASIALDGVGAIEEVEELAAKCREFRAMVEGEAWQARKESLGSAMAERGFWQREQRFDTLGAIEAGDRFEGSVANAAGILKRIQAAGGDGPPRERYSETLVRRLALQLFLLEQAAVAIERGESFDAFLAIESSREGGSRSFAQRLTGMYEAWAARRGMKLEVLERRDDRDGFAIRFSVSGFAAYSLLAPEAGLHVFEEPNEQGGMMRDRARVLVARQPARPASDDDDLASQARRAFASSSREAEVVRRYRERPSPLVRDGVRPFRTGRLDAVLGGDFDLIR